MARLGKTDQALTDFINERAPWIWQKYPGLSVVEVVMAELDRRIPARKADPPPRRADVARVPHVRPGSPEWNRLTGGG